MKLCEKINYLFDWLILDLACSYVQGMEKKFTEKALLKIDVTRESLEITADTLGKISRTLKSIADK